MQLLGNLKIHFLALVLTVVAEFIGIKKTWSCCIVAIIVHIDSRFINFYS